MGNNEMSKKFLLTTLAALLLLLAPHAVKAQTVATPLPAAGRKTRLP